MSPEELQEADLNTNTLREEIETLERELSEKSEGFSQTFESKPITWENVKSALKPNEVAVELVRFRVFNQVFTDSVLYAAIYIDNESQDSKPRYFLFRNGVNMENKFFANFRNSIKFRIRDELSYDRYWKPFEDNFGLTKTIYISPDGVFNQINLEAIPTPDGKYVIDNSHIVLVNNTKDIYFREVRSRIVQEEKLATLVGNPTFYASAEKTPPAGSEMRGSVINQLPGTEKEVAELSKLLKKEGWTTQDYVEGEASEQNLKKIEDPKLFHIATHGFFTSDKAIKTEIEGVSLSQYEALENPLLRTGLLLKGAGDLLGTTAFNYNIESGILTAYEAMNLQLDKTELVVLSACETGLGDIEIGEGVYGLQRAFLVAGAETIIMSLFKVSDEATQKLMVNFYNKWINSGNKRQAFIEAKKEIRNEYQDPIYWGAFVMIGLDY
jgi:CHAT domain-containing protein